MVFFHFTFLSIYFLLSNSLPLGYVDFRPLPQYDCHFRHHSIFLSRQKRSLQLSVPRFCGFSDLFAVTLRCVGYVCEHLDWPLSLSRITGAKCQSWRRAPCPFQKQPHLDAADLVGWGRLWRFIGQVFTRFSPVLLFLSILGIISCHSLVDPSLFLVSVRSWCPFYMSWASDFYVLRHLLLFFLGFILV